MADEREAANRRYFASGAWRGTAWRGVPVYKYRSDLEAYARIILATRPDLIIETGTAMGGSALFFRDMLDRAGRPDAQILTIDGWEYLAQPLPHDCRQVVSHSLDPPAVHAAIEAARRAGSVMVSLDSDHTDFHVLAELGIYAPLVTPGQYCVVEDTFLGFWGITEGETEERFRAGSSWHALQRFLPTAPHLVADREIEPFITMTPGGWLRHV